MSSETKNDVLTESESETKIKIKRRKLAGRRKYCPKCLAPLVLASSLSGWLVPEFYACSKCDYSGYVALEDLPKED